jgi:predicted nucleotidyltransferase
MPPSSLMDVIVQERTGRRLKTATALVASLTGELERHGVDVVVIGSLATGRFRSHSDVDLLVRSDINASRRGHVEREVSKIFRGTGITYDLIFASDLTTKQLKEFECDLIHTSGVREART